MCHEQRMNEITSVRFSYYVRNVQLSMILCSVLAFTARSRWLLRYLLLFLQWLKLGADVVQYMELTKAISTFNRFKFKFKCASNTQNMYDSLGQLLMVFHQQQRCQASCQYAIYAVNGHMHIKLYRNNPSSRRSLTGAIGNQIAIFNTRVARQTHIYIN